MPQQFSFRTLVTAAAAVGAVCAALTPRALYAQASESKTAEQVYQNITQLKGLPADQVRPAMDFMTSALGVDCAFCHNVGKFEADDKPAKKTARDMMAMQAMINKASFGGRTQVTCYSCHRGSTRPVNMPPIEGATPTAMTPPGAPPRATPSDSTVDSILEKYIAAVGGADAIKKVTTRSMKGVILAGGTATNIDVLTKAPNKRVSVTHNAPIESQADSYTRKNDQYTAYDGTKGWMGSSGKPARDMSGPESENASVDAEFALPLRIKEIFPQVRKGRAEVINGMECDVLNGSGPGKPSVRLYFDNKSGLLVRMIRYMDTPVGRMPTQIDYDQYRAVGTVKIPFRWQLSRPAGRFTIQINDASENVPIDDSKFEKPAGDVK